MAQRRNKGYDTNYLEFQVSPKPKNMIKSSLLVCRHLREFPKIRGTLFGVLIMRILLFRVLY